MPDLPDVEQKFTADAAEYLAAVDSIIASLDRLVAKTGDVRTAMMDMAAVTNAAAGTVDAAMTVAADAVGKLGTAAAQSAAVTSAAMDLAANSVNDLRTSAVTTAASMSAVGNAALGAAAKAAVASAAFQGMGRGDVNAGLFSLRDALAQVAAQSVAAAAGADKAGTAAAGATTWWGRWGNIIHWVVMGTLEIAATAVPAMLAFGAAVFAMAPAFTFIKDQMTNLVIASGSLSGAIRNSASPLNSLAAGLGRVQAAATPDAFIIFGSAISIVSSHMGVFAGVASQAANVLASFASKLATELSGPMGQQLAGFFSNAIKYMVQWGQFLGNIGHTFVNVVSSMWGVGQLLLDVLNLISRALLAISSNPVGAWFIGVAAAMSAAYRYGTLLMGVWKWLGGSALVGALKGIVGTIMSAGYAFMAADTAAAGFGDAMATIGAAIPPVAIAMAAIAVALGLWYLATRHTADATQQLIARVEAAPPTIMNLTAGIATLSNALVKTDAVASHLGPTMNGVVSRLAGPGLAGAALQANQDVQALTQAISTQEGKLAHLEIGLLQAGNSTGLLRSNMLALSIATDLQDSKLSALNQAWDNYFSILSGGMSSVAAFSTSLNNITQVAGTTTQNLGTYVGTLNLSTKQFSDMLASGAVKGAAAWTNFSQVTQSTIPQMIDWFRTAYTAGAITSQNFSKSVLDMIAPLMKFATTGGPQAQAILVGLAQAAGLGITSFPQLQNAIKSSNASLANLNTQASNATVALSQMNSVAKNLSNTLSVQEANAIANAAIKASGFTTDINNMMKAEQTHSTVGGLTWQQWAAKADAAQQQVQAMAAKSVKAIQNIGSAVQALPSGKTITISVGLVGPGVPYMGSVMGKGGGGSSYTYNPTSGLYAGKAWGGYIDGPGTKTSDSVPVMASRGEFMMSASAVDHYGKGFFAALNAKKLAAGGPTMVGGHNTPHGGGFGGGGGLGSGPPVHLHSNIIVELDGKQLASIFRTDILTYVRRNIGNNLTLLHR